MKEEHKNLLIELISVQSSISEDTAINEFIKKKLKEISGVKVSTDKFGNIYATKGKGINGFKTIVSHTDTVHSIYRDRRVFIYDDILFTMAKNENTYKDSKVIQVGTGGDDRCGIFTCIRALQDFDNIKAVFFRFEESGCRGSNSSNIKFFDDSNFVVQCDRRNDKDFITYTNGIEVASMEFKASMEKIYTKYNFKSSIGLATDVGALKRNGLNVSACNLSSGYYDPHTNGETISITDLQNTYNLVSDMFNTYGDIKFEHKYSKPVSTFTEFKQLPFRALPKSSTFSIKMNSNYFSDEKTATPFHSKFIEIVQTQDRREMIEIGNSNIFKYIGSDVFDINDQECPVCKKQKKLIFMPEEGVFYCSNHNDFVNDPELFRNAALNLDDEEYAFDKYLNIWMPTEDCKWSKKLGTNHSAWKSLNYE
jgi:hypothetical protein